MLVCTLNSEVTVCECTCPEINKIGSTSCSCTRIGNSYEAGKSLILSDPVNIRVKRGPQESVPEGMFDDSINLVVWGHEHDCRIVPEPVAGKEYYITQPGSSVATSLADGESLEKYRVNLLTTLCFGAKRKFLLDMLLCYRFVARSSIWSLSHCGRFDHSSLMMSC